MMGVSVFSNVRCYKPTAHQIPVVQLTNSPPHTGIIPSVFVVCERKHIWNYEYNPIVQPNNPLIMDGKVQDVEKIDASFYKDVFLKLPFDVGEHYDYFQSLYLLGYSYGVAVAIRALIELFIRDNYGNFIFQLIPGKKVLHIKDDIVAITEISDKFKSPGLTVVLSSLSGQTFQGHTKLRKCVESRVNSTSTNQIWVSQNSFKTLADVYQKVSKTVHGTPSGAELVDLKKYMITVLNVIKEYFGKHNIWGVNYA